MNDEEAVRAAVQKQNLNNAQQVDTAKKNINNINNNINRANNSINNNARQINNDINKNNQQQKIRQQKNDDANQNAVKAAANAASHSGHPVAAAIGKGINAADKATGGAVSRNLGKSAGKILGNSGLKGKLAQKALNKMNDSGMTDRISQATNRRKNGFFGQSSPISERGQGSFLGKGQSPFEISDSLSETKDELDDNSVSNGLTNFKVSKKVIIGVVGVIIPSFIAVILVVVLITSSQTYLTASKLGQADSVIDGSSSEAIEKVFSNEEKLNKEYDDVSYIYDVYVKETKDNFNKYEFAAKKENEIDSENLTNDRAKILSELEEFYPDIVKYSGEDYNQNDVYKFFIKLYNVYHYYYGKGVRLDMPLLMSVLNLQSTDMEEIFKLNTVGYDKEAIEKGTNNPDFDINKDWSNYKSTRNNSAHDIEVLAQAMVKEGSSASSGSKDGDYVGDIEFMTGGIGDIYYFNQLDYPNEPYSSYGTIASHGCGPTSLSIVVSSLLKEVHDPIELTNKVCSIGGCFNEGSSWDSITQTPPLYGLQVNRTTNTQEVISALGTGKSLVIAIMCPGHFTSGGHFIVLTGTNSNGEVTVADPASRDRSTNWDFNIVAEENCGAYWIVNK